MKIYLDLCSIQRPLDEKNHIRIAIEAEAIMAVLRSIESGQISLVSSDALIFEAIRNPNETRKNYALATLDKASQFIKINDKVEKRAKKFVEHGIKPLDALHLACGEESKADFFCTCDDKFLKKAKSIVNLKLKIVSPMQLMEEIDL